MNIDFVHHQTLNKVNIQCTMHNHAHHFIEGLSGCTAHERHMPCSQALLLACNYCMTFELRLEFKGHAIISKGEPGNKTTIYAHTESAIYTYTWMYTQ